MVFSACCTFTLNYPCPLKRGNLIDFYIMDIPVLAHYADDVKPWEVSMDKRCVCWMAALVVTPVLTLAAVELPLKQVVLFNSGVGYFGRQATVEGSDAADLAFTTTQINDVIKSLVFIDESSGTVSAVTYESRDPIARTLKSFRIDLSGDPSLAALLGNLRGLAVRIKTSGQDLAGRILGVEKKAELKGEEIVIEKSFLNVATPDGLRSLNLDDIQTLKFDDEAVNKDLEAALKALAGSHNTDKKGVHLEFAGKGKRDVRVGYMIETPVWKTSYRLVIGKKELLLQGWAHVENTTDDDWNKVRLSLVSGRPISFVQNLYDPIYLARPVVEMETYGAIAPPKYEGAVTEAEESRPGRATAARMRSKMSADESLLYGMAVSDAMPAPAAPPPLEVNMNLAGGVAAAAEQREAGELFAYEIEEPVTLPRQQSAMIPIVNDKVEGAPLSIYNQRVDAKYPLNGVELKNTSGKFLMQGPVTVFEDGIYAGDARLKDTQKNEEVLLSYSLDLACEVALEKRDSPEEIVGLKILNGLLYVSRKYEDTTTYRLNNKRKDKRALILEHPYRADWKLTEPAKEPERTAQFYRFRLNLEPGKEAFVVKEQRTVSQAVGLTGLAPDNIEFYLEQRVITKPVREALKKLAALQGQLADLIRERQLLEQKLAEIAADQDRIRKNMVTVQKNSDIYSRWERKLNEQENQIDQSSLKLDQLREDEQKKRAEIATYIAGLNIE